MLIREYQKSDCKELTELFYNTVHTVNAKDYTKEHLYQQEQAQKAQLARQEEAHRAQLARQEREREARLKYYTVCPFCDGVNQGAKFCLYCDSSLAYGPEEESR